MKTWGFLFLSTVFLFADPPFLPNVRINNAPENQTLNEGESSFTVWRDTIYAVCNIAERPVIAALPFGRSVSAGDTFELNYNFVDTTVGITWHTDPVIGVDDSGHVHLLVQFSVDRIQHYLSRDGGLTWAETTWVSDPFSGGDVDKPWMVVWNNHVYVAWQEFGGTQSGIRFARSDDYGRTFSRLLIDPLRHGIAALNIDPQTGILYLAYVAWGEGVYFTYSVNGGLNWATPQWLANVSYSDGIGDRAPIISLAVHGQVLFITWVDDRFGNWDILGMRSVDGGMTWEGPWVINEIGTGGQCKGWAAFDPYGGLHVFFYTTPDWPTTLWSLWEVHYRYSPDSGLSWAPEVPITDTAFLGHYYGNRTNFLGDYHTIQADSHWVYAVWSDGRDGNMNLYFAKAPLNAVGIAEVRNSNLNPLSLRYEEGCPVLFWPLSVSPVEVRLFSPSGRRIGVWQIPPGVRAWRLPGKLPSGIYTAQVRFGERVDRFKLILLR